MRFKSDSDKIIKVFSAVCRKRQFEGYKGQHVYICIQCQICSSVDRAFNVLLSSIVSLSGLSTDDQILLEFH